MCVALTSTSDHPRSRGEYVYSNRGNAPHDGSSPLSRGILPCGGQCSVEFGIIPALAGNTLLNLKLTVNPWDHPRSRGEYPPWQERTSQCLGSSPLSRGILYLDGSGSFNNRIIPALAGNTSHGDP